MEQGAATLPQIVIAAWALVAVACFALGIVAYVAVRSRARQVDLEKAAHAFQSLNIESFRNLVDANEEAFRRENLSPQEFREIKQLRAWAVLLYSWESGAAAAALAKIGRAAQRSSDPEVAASGAQVAESAFRL
jgi:hypothetical protein